jgi:hypothetical protein
MRPCQGRDRGFESRHPRHRQRLSLFRGWGVFVSGDTHSFGATKIGDGLNSLELMLGLHFQIPFRCSKLCMTE